MKKQQTRLLLFLVAFLLAISICGLVISAISIARLQAYEERYTMNNQELICVEHQQEIDALKTSNALLRETNAQEQEKGMEQMRQDAEYVMTTFYTINEENSAASRYDKLKAYLGGSFAQYVKLVSKSIQDYTQSIRITDCFVQNSSGESGKALCFATITSTGGKISTSNSNLYLLTLKYNAETGKWQTTDCKVAEHISAESFVAP